MYFALHASGNNVTKHDVVYLVTLSSVHQIFRTNFHTLWTVLMCEKIRSKIRWHSQMDVNTFRLRTADD